MKTYFTFFTLCTLLIFACSKSENEPLEDENTGIEADYVVLLNKDEVLKPQLLLADAETLSLNPAESSLLENTVPDLTYFDGSKFIQYHKDGNCAGQITTHDFKTDTSKTTPVFTDLNDCDLTATAIALSEKSVFVAYKMTSPNPNDYLVRIIDLSTSESTTIDITLDKKPVDLAVANNRLFVLTFDELITDENSLSVFDLSNNSLIHEMDLGYSVRRIFTDTQKNIIISYDELHTTLNSVNMSFEYTQYEDNTAPKFSSATSSNFDLDGRLYYPMEPGENSSYPLVPAIYDFSKKLVVLYAYENFLTEQKRNFEYEIETTTAVGYDEENGLMLVGYKKMNTASKDGGLLRIRLAPEPALIDHIDLDGVPTKILVN